MRIAGIELTPDQMQEIMSAKQAGQPNNDHAHAGAISSLESCRGAGTPELERLRTEVARSLR